MDTEPLGTKRKRRRENLGFLPFLVPGLLGFGVFFLAPFLISMRYVFLSPGLEASFVGLENFKTLFSNELFLSALGNTLAFLGLCIPTGLVFSYLLAAALRKMPRWQKPVSVLLLLPLVVPSGAAVYIWDCIIRVEGLINRFFLPGVQPVNWAESNLSILIAATLFLWKYIGYNTILFYTGLNLIPASYYEVARLEGGGVWQVFRRISLVYIAPTGFLVLLMTIVNSFKSFRELFILFGNRPSTRFYMLQHFMNAQFTAVNMPSLSTTSLVLTCILVVVIALVFGLQRRISQDFDAN